jgi:hypothetical protein
MHVLLEASPPDPLDDLAAAAEERLQTMMRDRSIPLRFDRTSRGTQLSHNVHHSGVKINILHAESCRRPLVGSHPARNSPARISSSKTTRMVVVRAMSADNDL